MLLRNKYGSAGIFYPINNMLREGAKNTLRGGGVHNEAAFGRKCVLPPFFSSPKYTPPIFPFA